MAVCYTRIVRELNRSHHDWTLTVCQGQLTGVCDLRGMFRPHRDPPLPALHTPVGGRRGELLWLLQGSSVSVLPACLDPFLFLLMSKSDVSKLYFMTLNGKTLNISTWILIWIRIWIKNVIRIIRKSPWASPTEFYMIWIRTCITGLHLCQRSQPVAKLWMYVTDYQSILSISEYPIHLFWMKIWNINRPQTGSGQLWISV